MSTTTYAIVNVYGDIISLHAEPLQAGEGWGFDRELVELIRPHRIGDQIDWNDHGIEIQNLGGNITPRGLRDSS